MSVGVGGGVMVCDIETECVNDVVGVKLDDLDPESVCLVGVSEPVWVQEAEGVNFDLVIDPVSDGEGVAVVVGEGDVVRLPERPLIVFDSERL